MKDSVHTKKMLSVFAIIDRKDSTRPAYWMNIGTAFQNQDGSINLYLDAFPVGPHHKLQVRESRPALPRNEPPGLTELSP